MLRKITIVFMASLALVACSFSSDSPRIVRASADMPEVRLTEGMATQIELPSSGRVQSVTTGNPALVVAERTDNVVNLVPKEGSGETNLIIRSIDEDGDVKVYQYRVIVQAR